MGFRGKDARLTNGDCCYERASTLLLFKIGFPPLGLPWYVTKQWFWKVNELFFI